MAGRAPRHEIRAAARAERVAVVAARFNEPIVKRLLDGAMQALARHGVAGHRVDVHWVPGAFELPQAAHVVARTRRYAAVVCLGVVIKGATPHHEYLASAAAHGIVRAGVETGVPMSFGVVTTLDEAQAWERAGGAVGNRGEEAALAAIEMARFVRDLGRPRRRP